MKDCVWAIPGLMPPTAPNKARHVEVPEDGSMFLCVHCGRNGETVNFSVRRGGWGGGLIKDPSYDFGALEENPRFVARKSGWAQYMILSTVLPDGADVLTRIIANDIPVPVTERNDIPDCDKMYWILEMPAGTMPPGQSVLELVINGKVERHVVERKEFSIHRGGPHAFNSHGRDRHQRGESLDLMIPEGGQQTVILGLGLKGREHIEALPNHTEFRAFVCNGFEDIPASCHRNGGELSVTFPELGAGRATWRCEFKVWENWIPLCSGDIVSLASRKENAYKGLRMVGPYLYEVSYDTIDMQAAREYYEKDKPAVSGGCTSMRSGDIVGRNYDWLYSDTASFIIKTPGVIGMAGPIDALSDGFVKSGHYSKYYEVLPYRLVDGINHRGLVVSSHVVPAGDKGDNSVVEPAGSPVDELCASMLPMVLLDRFGSALEAAKWVRDSVRVFNYAAMAGNGYELHFLLADKERTLALEFVGGRTEIVDITDSPVLTNFHRHGVTLNEDGTVMTPATGDAGVVNGVTPHGAGLERFNEAVSLREQAGNRLLMLNAMSSLWYSRTYPTACCQAVPRRDTEFVGDGLTVSMPSSAFDGVWEPAGEAWSSRNRLSPLVWHSVHTSVYDISRCELLLVSQEDGDALYTVKISHHQH